VSRSGVALGEATPALEDPKPTGTRAREGGAEMFDSIARRYDLLNRVLSMGLDGGWRRKAIALLRPEPGHVILDLCTGTGDFGLATLETPGTQVIGLDVAREMVRIARHKVRKRGLDQRFRLGLGDAESLPLADASVNGATIAFGIRNVADRPKALRELARVIRPGGRLVILEFGVPPNALFRAGYFLYFRHILPVIGGILSGNSDAYAYLPDSVRRFPGPDEFLGQCRAGGFASGAVRRLTGGIVNLYVCTR